MTAVDDSPYRVTGAGVDHRGLEVSLPLVFEYAGESRCVGTAIAAAPGLAITAEHVVGEEILRRNRLAKNAGHKIPIAIVALQVFEGRLHKWAVDQIYGSRTTDIAFLRLRRLGDDPTPLPGPEPSARSPISRNAEPTSTRPSESSLGRLSIGLVIAHIPKKGLRPV